MKRLYIVTLPLVIVVALALFAPITLSDGLLKAGDAGTPSPTSTASPVPSSTPTATSAAAEALPSPASFAPGVLPCIGQLADAQRVLIDLYGAVNPSVVNVWTQVKLGELFQEEKPAEGETLPSQSSRRLAPGQFGLPQPLGSGFVWDREGHIVTNNHVVQDAEKLFVTFADGLTLLASVVGQDTRTDLAVLKVEAPEEALHPVTMADSTQMEVGQFAVALGNPFGFEGSMTFGIISALGRYIPVWNQDRPSGAEPEIIPDVIQTDAPVNPGNSGGVLVDLNGHVVGVTSNGVAGLDWSTGVAFAIPSVIVQRVVPALIEDGSYEPPWLGANAITLMPELAEAMGLPKAQQGALVVDVSAKSPADEAGVHGSSKRVTIDDEDWLAGGDVIVAIGDQSIKRAEDIDTYLVRHTGPGESIKLTAIRDGKEITLEVKVGTKPVAESGETKPAQAAGGDKAWLGIKGATLTGELARAMKLEESQSGVLVQSVVAGSPADQADLRGGYRAYSVNGEWVMIGGDVIVSADLKPTSSVENLAEILAKMSPGDKLALTILRGGKQVDVATTLAAPPAESM